MNPNRVILRETDLETTYLGGQYDRVWMGDFWDIGLKQWPEGLPTYHLYFKGTYILTVNRLKTALEIVLDRESNTLAEMFDLDGAVTAYRTIR